MKGYDHSTYGDAFADVYDDWYGEVSDVAATVERLAAIVGARPGPADRHTVLELGVGTGRLAIPLAARIRPAVVTGIDSSSAMLQRLAANDAVNRSEGCEVRAVIGDMATDLPAGPFDLIFVAFNTFFNLGSAERQQQCITAVAARLAPGGSFVVEADVPEQPAPTGTHVDVRSLSADRVVLSVARYDGTRRTAEGQFIELTEAGGVRLRPWSIRAVTVGELDEMAAAAGLARRDRWEDFSGRTFTAESHRHVSVYARSAAASGTDGVS